MNRVLVVAGDRALTRFVAEALLERSLSAPTRSADRYAIARAHSALEATLLITRGGRPFDVIIVDQTLPDREPLKLIEELAETPEAKDVPIYLMWERGREPHSRRMAVDELGVAAFIEKPATAETLRLALDKLERKISVLLIESRADLSERYATALMRAGYLVEIASTGRVGVDRAPRFRPDIVVAALILEDMPGLEVCVDIKRTPALRAVPVVLYGQVSALANREISENAERADDFVQAPFDDEILVERVGALVGRGTEPSRRRRRALRLAERARAPDIEETQEGAYVGSLLPTVGGADEARASVTPPPSASPSPFVPTKRATRRVPCNLSMSVQSGGQVYQSMTLDISHGGIFIETDEPLPIGTAIDMTFQIPTSERTIHAVGKVAWVGGGGPAREAAGVGVKFSRIDPQDLQLIVDYVNRVSKVVYSPS